MNEYPRLSVQLNVDTDAECLYKYVYGTEDIFNPHRHDFFEIFVTISGTVTHWINGQTQLLPEGCLVLIRPDDAHGYLYNTPQNTETAYVNLTFTRETAKLLFDYLFDSFPSHPLLSCDMPPTVTLNSIEKKRLLAQISELNLVNWSDKKALKLRMRAILTDIFVRHFSNLPDHDNSHMPVWLSEVLRAMEHPDNFIVGTERMVQLCKKSREHLMRSIKKYCAFTISEYINEQRLNYAANMLLHTNTPILEICFACGFQSTSYFYKAFKNKFKLSPSDFRKQFE